MIFKPIRMRVVIGREPRRCEHTEQLEGVICTGCVRVLIAQLLGFVNEGQEHGEEELALGLLGKGLVRLDQMLAGVTATLAAGEAERGLLNGLTAAELEKVRVYGYTLPEVARAVEIVQELGLEHRLRGGAR